MTVELSEELLDILISVDLGIPTCSQIIINIASGTKEIGACILKTQAPRISVSTKLCKLCYLWY